MTDKPPRRLLDSAEENSAERRWFCSRGIVA